MREKSQKIKIYVKTSTEPTQQKQGTNNLSYFRGATCSPSPSFEEQLAQEFELNTGKFLILR